MLKEKYVVRELRLWLPVAANTPDVQVLLKSITKAAGGVTKCATEGTDADGTTEPVLVMHWCVFDDWGANLALGDLCEVVRVLLSQGQNSVLVDYGDGDGPTLYYDEPISG